MKFIDHVIITHYKWEELSGLTIGASDGKCSEVTVGLTVPSVRPVIVTEGFIKALGGRS